ncbi:enolase C-terminal domain-like protein [Blattabacterium cuenoti]|uniref:enolase C-terminal domain-like protein n=1 Tax=Blattabacterium cuenoti TaxID=1653831 RepID=UPI00163C41E7|nr:enolase C-terminal domain-like protein [Blattabacterium cuenoti]
MSNSYRVFSNNIVWFIILKKNNKIGIGECNPLLDKLCLINFNQFEKELKNILKKVFFLKKIEMYYYYKYISYSSIFFGLEQAFLSLKNQFPILYNSSFTNGKQGIPINDLIWINDFKNKNNVIKKIKKKIFEGFLFLKIKISFNLFDYQYSILKKIKKKYPFIKIRVDANGCFDKTTKYLYYINKLYDLNIIHSIEQPIISGNWKKMSKICKESKLPIALDEELEGIFKLKNKKKLLDIINPQYLVLKPSVNGGFYGCKEWILEANKRNIKWCISSSLESNIGINAISQWTFIINKKYGYKNCNHGLNTGILYINNWISSLEIKKGKIWYNPFLKWNIFF